jgi:hypothetical protein
VCGFCRGSISTSPSSCGIAPDRTQGSAGTTLATARSQGTTKSLSTAVENALLTITPVNDAPVLTLSGTIDYIRDTPAVTLAPFATVTDVDSQDFAGGRLRVRVPQVRAGAAKVLNNTFVIRYEPMQILGSVSNRQEVYHWKGSGTGKSCEK